MDDSASSPRSRGAALAVAVVSFVAGVLVFLLTFDNRSWLSGVDDPMLAFVVGTLSRPEGVPRPVDEGHKVFAPPPSGESRVMVAMYKKGGAATYQDWPPGPLDVAVLLSALRDQKAEAVAVTLPPVWPVAPEGTLATQALRTAVAGGGVVLFCVEPAFVAVPREGSAEVFASLPGVPVDP